MSVCPRVRVPWWGRGPGEALDTHHSCAASIFDTFGALGRGRYLQYEGGSHSEIIGHNCSSVDLAMGRRVIQT